MIKIELNAIEGICRYELLNGNVNGKLTDARRSELEQALHEIDFSRRELDRAPEGARLAYAFKQAHFLTQGTVSLSLAGKIEWARYLKNVERTTDAGITERDREIRAKAAKLSMLPSARAKAIYLHNNDFPEVSVRSIRRILSEK